VELLYLIPKGIVIIITSVIFFRRHREFTLVLVKQRLFSIIAYLVSSNCYNIMV